MFPIIDTSHLRHDPDISRLLATFRHEPTDRLPNLEFLIGQRNVEAILGRPSSISWALSPEDYVELAHCIGQDAIGGQIFTRDGQLYQGIPERSLGSRQVLKDFMSGGRIHPTSPNHARAEAFLAGIEGTKLGVWCHLTGGFTMTYEAVGFEQFCLMLYDDLPFIEELLERALEDSLQVIEDLLQYPFSFFHIGDDMGFKTGLMYRPDVIREIWVPRIRRLIEPIRAKGIPVTFHSDGKIDELIPDIIDMGFCAINPIETPAMDIYSLNEQFGNQLAFIGNIDVAGPLAFGNPEEIEQEVMEHVERLSPGGGYVGATSHSVIDGIPPQNFVAMLAAFQKCGNFPVAS